jgi:predicted DNA-binding protein
MPFSFRLDPETEAHIRRLSAETGRSRSAVVREAVARYSATSQQHRRDQSAFDRLKAYGTVNSGGANYSVETHKKYREALRQKYRAKRSR